MSQPSLVSSRLTWTTGDSGRFAWWQDSCVGRVQKRGKSLVAYVGARQVYAGHSMARACSAVRRHLTRGKVRSYRRTAR